MTEFNENILELMDTTGNKALDAVKAAFKSVTDHEIAESSVRMSKEVSQGRALVSQRSREEVLSNENITKFVRNSQDLMKSTILSRTSSKDGRDQMLTADKDVIKEENEFFKDKEDGKETNKEDTDSAKDSIEDEVEDKAKHDSKDKEDVKEQEIKEDIVGDGADDIKE